MDDFMSDASLPQPPLMEAALAIREMYISLRAADFTEDEATKILGVYLANVNQTDTTSDD